jgi:hypothetical protein
MSFLVSQETTVPISSTIPVNIANAVLCIEVVTDDEDDDDDDEVTVAVVDDVGEPP